VGNAVRRRNAIVHEHRFDQAVFQGSFDEPSDQLVDIALADRAIWRLTIAATIHFIALAAFRTDALDHFQHAPMIPVHSLDCIFTIRRHSDFLTKNWSDSDEQAYFRQWPRGPNGCQLRKVS
jgi:hypothetical protein